MLFRRGIFLAIIFAGLLPTQDLCALTIDSFETFQLVSDSGGGQPPDSMPSPVGTIVPTGGARDIFAEKTNGAFGRARVVIADALFYTSETGVLGQFSVDYIDLAGVDFSTADGVTITGTLDTSAVGSGGSTIGLMLEDAAANHAFSAVTLTDASFTHTFEFSGFTGVDSSQINHIRLGSFNDSGAMVDVPAGGDVTIVSLQTTIVPEPANLVGVALVILGALGIVRILRAKRT